MAGEFVPIPNGQDDAAPVWKHHRAENAMQLAIPPLESIPCRPGFLLDALVAAANLQAV